MLKSFLSGAIVLCAWAISLFFYRFQIATRERLFGYYFVLFGLDRIAIEFLPEQFGSPVYLIRLAAFLLLVFGILDKNRKEKKP